jgi:hypothetical protein
MNIRTRFVNPKKPVIMVPGKDLVPHPMNWRTHPTDQIDALKGVLSEIGIVDALKGFRLPDGRIQLIDGHARAEILADQDVPVLLLNVTEEEAKKLLTVYDPIGDLAGVEKDKLESLLKELQTDSPALMLMAEELAAAHGIGEPEKKGKGGSKSEGKEEGGDEVPPQFQILVVFDSEAKQAEWLTKLAAEGLNCRSLIS